MALEMIRDVEPNYKGKVYRTRLDWLAKAVSKPIHIVRSVLLNDGAEFDDPTNIAPESWFSFNLKDVVDIETKPRRESGVTLKTKKGKKIGRNIPEGQLDDWNG
jgi:hypothetical protein